ncbi:amidohydrolase family protein [bacterium]|nr:amidohydrolase family protein [bacterium]
MKGRVIPRRSILKGAGALGPLAVLHSKTAHGEDKKLPDIYRTINISPLRKELFDKVFSTPFIDTHEHLFEESERLAGTATPGIRSDDWTMVFSLYVSDDMMTAGMSQQESNRFFSPDVAPNDKWRLLEPCWPYIRNTGYGQAVCIAIRELYGVDELTAQTVRQVQAGYERVRQAGFYRYILGDLANIESCQVNCIIPPFRESAMPLLLMQDISILRMYEGPDIETYANPAGIRVTSLSDWHRVIDWWFDKYGAYAVAVKSQNAYSRDIDYERIPGEKVEGAFKRLLDGQTITIPEKKAIEDHLFWYAADKAVQFDLPVKLHTGYYVGHDYMPLSRLMQNPGSAADLCRRAPDTKFVFMHICYPLYEDMIALAKHYTNAYVDMCWSWIINPVAAKDFLKKFLVTAPANKVFTFGGDYYSVEAVLGHAMMARQGIALALSELVEEGWMSRADALEIVDPVMHENARAFFNLDEKKKVLEKAPWR